MTAAQSAMGLLYTTWPDARSAEDAADVLLSEHLIACANILGEARSIYRWNGSIERSHETIVLFKTSAAKAETARTRIAQLHPYDEPAILDLAVGARGSSQGFLDWVNAETGAPPG